MREGQERPVIGNPRPVRRKTGMVANPEAAEYAVDDMLYNEGMSLW